MATPFEKNRTPCSGKPSAGSIATPILRSAATVSGIKPSPQALSTGGFAPSATVTENPLARNWIAAASPAGPPPTINTSVFGFVLKPSDDSNRPKTIPGATTPQHLQPPGQAALVS